MQSDLIFRGAHQECAHNSKEISCFSADLVFRDVPGKSAQRSGHTQRLRRPLLCVAPLETIAGRVVRVLRPPPSLGLFPSRRLAIRLTARTLTRSDPRIGTEPPAADGTGSLPGSGHRDSSSLRSTHRSGAQIKRAGSFFESRAGKLFASAEAPLSWVVPPQSTPCEVDAEKAGKRIAGQMYGEDDLRGYCDVARACGHPEYFEVTENLILLDPAPDPEMEAKTITLLEHHA